MDTFWTLIGFRADDYIGLSTRKLEKVFVKPTVFTDKKTVASIAKHWEKSYDKLNVSIYGEVGERLKPTVC